MARRDKLWSFCTFCHPEAASPMTCGDKLWSFRSPFCHLDTIVSDGTQRQIMVILRLLSSRGGEPDDMRRQIMVILPKGDCVRWRAETNYGHSAPFHPGSIVSDGTQRQIMVILHPFVIQRRSCPMAHRDKLWSFCAFPSRLDRVRWHVETNYGHSAPLVIQRWRAR